MLRNKSKNVYHKANYTVDISEQGFFEIQDSIKKRDGMSKWLDKCFIPCSK